MKLHGYFRWRQCSTTALRLLALLLLMGWQVGAGQNDAALEHPVMVDSNASGSQLFVLDSSGNLHALQVGTNKLQESGRFAVSPELTPADMAYASWGGQEALLIAGMQAGHGVVMSYSLDGRPLKTWELPNLCSGIDFSAKTHSAFVATSDSREIFRVDLQGTKSIFVARISDATKLGPLAFDEAHQTIYVADVASGRIYEYALATRTTSVLLTGLSAPTALSYDPDGRRLYVADPGRRAIYRVDMNSAKPVASQFAANPLKAPYGMALTSNNQLAVADYAANSIAVFSGKGALLFRFPE